MNKFVIENCAESVYPLYIKQPPAMRACIAGGFVMAVAGSVFPIIRVPWWHS